MEMVGMMMGKWRALYLKRGRFLHDWQGNPFFEAREKESSLRGFSALAT